MTVSTFGSTFGSTFDVQGLEPTPNGGAFVTGIPSWNTVEVRGTYRHKTGQPYEGSVTFVTIPYIYAPSDSVIIPGGDKQVVQLDATGSFSVQLPATNDVDIVPSGQFSYQVTESFSDVLGRTYSLQVPMQMQDTGIDLSRVAPLPLTQQPTGPSAFPTLQAFAELQDLVNTVVSGSVYMVNNKTGIVNLTAADVAADPAGAAAGARQDMLGFLATQGQPAAGPTNAVLVKQSNNDYDSVWSSALTLAGQNAKTTLALGQTDVNAPIITAKSAAFNTADYLTFNDAANVMKAKISSAGGLTAQSLTTPGGAVSNSLTVGDNGTTNGVGNYAARVKMGFSTADQVGMIIRGAPSGTADIVQVYNNANIAAFSLDYKGGLNARMGATVVGETAGVTALNVLTKGNSTGIWVRPLSGAVNAAQSSFPRVLVTNASDGNGPLSYLDGNGTIVATTQVASNIISAGSEAAYGGRSPGLYLNGQPIYLGSLNGQGSKTFVIDHPDRDDAYLVHATLEGPENGVYYRGQAKLTDGYASVKLPSYFESLVDENSVSVIVSAVQSYYSMAADMANPERTYSHVANVVASQVVKGEFIVAHAGGMIVPDQEFEYLVIGTRKDVPILDAEPLRSKFTKRGDGPYTYLVPNN